MTKRRKGVSPTLKVHIGEEQYERAVQSNSGGCLIADAIKAQYPHLSAVEVDMATIRATDREAGERYTYLTPPEAQHVLLAFDQGWPNPTSELIVRAAVHIRRIVSNTRRGRSEERKAKNEALKAKAARGEELTRDEKISVAQFDNKAAEPKPARPSSYGKAEVVEVPGQRPVVVGGRPPIQGPAHPNLLRGRNRHFGAKMADPGKAFNDAVEAALAEREKEREQAG